MVIINNIIKFLNYCDFLYKIKVLKWGYRVINQSCMQFFCNSNLYFGEVGFV